MKSIAKTNRKLMMLIASALLITGFIACRDDFEDAPPPAEPPQEIEGMVFVEGGTFMMGSDSADAYRWEKPVHRVTVSDFYIGKYEVTQREWQEVMGNNNNQSRFKGDNRPIENMTWYEAVEFCNKLSEKEGLEKCYDIDSTSVILDMQANGYRLPTEAEWEFAARGGNKSKGYKYSGSNDIDDVAWYDEYANGGEGTRDVGQKQANELGIYDMSGNVYEYCWDWQTFYSISDKINPIGDSTGSYRVMRGGAWYINARHCRITMRNIHNPGLPIGFLGFRIARRL